MSDIGACPIGNRKRRQRPTELPRAALQSSVLPIACLARRAQKSVNDKKQYAPHYDKSQACYRHRDYQEKRDDPEKPPPAVDATGARKEKGQERSDYSGFFFDSTNRRNSESLII
jgi:hypothetical protein